MFYGYCQWITVTWLISGAILENRCAVLLYRTVSYYVAVKLKQKSSNQLVYTMWERIKYASTHSFQ